MWNIVCYLCYIQTSVWLNVDFVAVSSEHWSPGFNPSARGSLSDEKIFLNLLSNERGTEIDKWWTDWALRKKNIDWFRWPHTHTTAPMLVIDIHALQSNAVRGNLWMLFTNLILCEQLNPAWSYEIFSFYR